MSARATAKERPGPAAPAQPLPGPTGPATRAEEAEEEEEEEVEEGVGAPAQADPTGQQVGAPAQADPTRGLEETVEAPAQADPTKGGGCGPAPAQEREVAEGAREEELRTARKGGGRGGRGRGGGRREPEDEEPLPFIPVSQNWQGADDFLRMFFGC